ncbi:MAG: damage-inducible protein DinB [Flavobacteriaceae bacterium]|nr:damage-inducible protein DinB [Flavobacteriaceae bacterium]
MKAFFQDTFEYTYHCNQRLIEELLKNPETYSEKIGLLASHTLNAHHVWNHRIFGVAPALSVWQHLEMDNLQLINNENFEHSKEVLQKNNLNKPINYTNSKGQNFTNTVGEILFHIINHSTYHRGQLISLLKTKGVEPIVTDYIFYKR